MEGKSQERKSNKKERRQRSVCVSEGNLEKHSCPSGLRGPSQERLSRDAWVRTPPDAFFSSEKRRQKKNERTNEKSKGDVAQMVEHSLRMRGARGSIPLISIQFFSRKSSQRKEKESVIREKRRRGKEYEAFVPEWSKGADLSSAIVRCVGSNPTGCIFGRKKSGKKKQ